MTGPMHIHVGGRDLCVAVRRSPLAGRMSLRLIPGDKVVVVLPHGVPEAEALRFARRQHDWIAARLAVQPGRIALVDGASVPILGVAHVIRHCPQGRRGVWAEDGALHVSGGGEHVARRVVDFLRAEARTVLAVRARELAAAIGRTVRKVAIRDTTSRWGSCAANGNLSFSWRLVMAPDWVVDYVVAHEVAHLAEMNHGPGFWGVVGGLTGDAAPARAWLKHHGPDLHRYGAQP